MRHKTFTRSGFTLVESILYMALFVILLGLLTGIFVSIIDAQQEAQTSSALQMDGEYILSRLEYDIGRADEIITPAVTGDVSDTLQMLIGGQAYTYTTDGTLMTLTLGDLTHRLNSYGTHVRTFSATRIGGGTRPTVRVNLGFESVVERVSGTNSMNYQTTYGLR